MNKANNRKNRREKADIVKESKQHTKPYITALLGRRTVEMFVDTICCERSRVIIAYTQCNRHGN